MTASVLFFPSCFIPTKTRSRFSLVLSSTSCSFFFFFFFFFFSFLSSFSSSFYFCNPRCSEQALVVAWFLAWTAAVDCRRRCCSFQLSDAASETDL
jgi:hypothetical protein